MLTHNTVQIRLINAVTHRRSNDLNYTNPLGRKSYTYYIDETVQQNVDIGSVVLVTQPDNTLDAGVIIGNKPELHAKDKYKPITKATQRQLRSFVQFAYRDWFFAENCYHEYQIALRDQRMHEYENLI